MFSYTLLVKHSLTLFWHTECGSPAYMEDFLAPVIINGRRATLGEWPWHSALMNNGRQICGSSYIGGEWALTASHCVDGRYG